MDQHKRLLRPQEEPDRPAGRLRLIVLLPAALLLLLAAAGICLAIIASFIPSALTV